MKTFSCLPQVFRSKIGYGRVSTAHPDANSQRDSLSCGTRKNVTDQVSGASVKRPELDKPLARLKARDVLMVPRLDRLGRYLPRLIEIVHDLETKGTHFQSLSEGIDMITMQGRLTFHLMGALAAFERFLRFAAAGR
ncbi:recombinase family protein [Stappia sp. MMSF_3263]|uniref:recombinase family protein n=1 Tax=Stappia sp. MMSF_3263 TaxID=3046693 RepID=UPI00273E0A48|nr:recombinase family protein [Stappia sp. MMSF_3263]